MPKGYGEPLKDFKYGRGMITLTFSQVHSGEQCKDRLEMVWNK